MLVVTEMFIIVFCGRRFIRAIWHFSNWKIWVSVKLDDPMRKTSDYFSNWKIWVSVKPDVPSDAKFTDFSNWKIWVSVKPYAVNAISAAILVTGRFELV